MLDLIVITPEYKIREVLGYTLERRLKLGAKDAYVIILFFDERCQTLNHRHSMIHTLLLVFFSGGQRWLVYSKNTKRGKLSLANSGLGLKSSPNGPLISSPYLAVNPLLPRGPSGRGGGTLGCCSLGGHPGRCPVT